MKKQSHEWRVKVLETDAVLSLVAILAGLFTGIRALLWTGALLLAVVLFVKPVAEILAKGWLWLSEKIGLVNSTIILTLLYYLILTPVAFLFRLCKNDPLDLAPGNRDSFYVSRDHTFSASDLEKMW